MRLPKNFHFSVRCNMYIIAPDPYLKPQYNISPFRTTDIAFNAKLHRSNEIDDYLKERFSGRRYVFTKNGREAIGLALSYYNLARQDLITILTSSSNYYVSSCVTTEIERFCHWNRIKSKDTSLLFLNHEFGYPVEGTDEFFRLGFPFIEDCAHSFFLCDSKSGLGVSGDFTVLSFPKMFPLQVGGLLLINGDREPKSVSILQPEEEQYIKNVLSYYIRFESEIKQRRILNYLFLREKFGDLGFRERFKLIPGIIPGVFMFITEGYNLDLTELKGYYFKHGIQCSVFYGEEAFFLPCHQNLEESDLLYFVEVMKSFLFKSKL